MEISTNKLSTQQKNKKRGQPLSSVYSRCLITRSIVLPITAIGKNIKETIENSISSQFEGKCLVEGYVKPNSSKLITYSSGLIERGINIVFEVVFECQTCYLVEGTLIYCVAKNITKAGIRGESSTDIPTPIIVYVARDHHLRGINEYFNSIKEGDKFMARVIGQRFELNDTNITVMCELVKPKNDSDQFIGGGKPVSSKTKLIINY